MSTVPQYSPWGRIDSTKEQAPGIWFVSTPSHGGFYLAEDRQREFETKLPTFKPFAGKPWYEEDCDWCAIAIVFPQHFAASTVMAAMHQAKAMATSTHGRDWKAVVEFLNNQVAEVATA
jgi:hypothetical protein